MKNKYYVEYYVQGDRREFWFEYPVALKTCQIAVAIINFLIMRDDLDGIEDISVCNGEWFPIFGMSNSDYLFDLVPCIPMEGR